VKLDFYFLAACDETFAAQWLNEHYEDEYRALLEEYTQADWEFNVDISDVTSDAAVSVRFQPLYFSRSIKKRLKVINIT